MIFAWNSALAAENSPMPTERKTGMPPLPEPAAAEPCRRLPAGPTRGRKLHLADDLHDRLWLLARQRRQSVSVVAAGILDRALPRFTITREG